MIVTVTGPIVHRCPFKDELDVGTFTMEYDPAEQPIEFHALRKAVEVFATMETDHEGVTQALAAAFPGVTVTTRWFTAGLEVEVRP